VVLVSRCCGFGIFVGGRGSGADGVVAQVGSGPIILLRRARCGGRVSVARTIRGRTAVRGIGTSQGVGCGGGDPWSAH
jgi:hypothetical protein